jgi:hypothetical protein
MTTTRQATFRATVLRDAGEWVAHCLDLDIVATGVSREAAVDALAEAVGLQLAYAREHDSHEQLYQLAPPEAWQKHAELLKGPHETMIRAIDDSGHDLIEAQYPKAP